MTHEATIRVYKCPSCNGALRFDAQAKTLSCIWCSNSFDVSDLEAVQVRPVPQGYVCPECGAQLMTEEFVAATTCPYCGNNEIAPHRFEGSFEPDLLIPFSVTRRQAVQSYEEVVASRRYLPNDYAGEARVVSVEGVYVPFWLQSGIVNFDFTYMGIYKKDKMNYESKHHRVGTYEFTRVPADGSRHMPDDVMDSIEPYHYAALVPYDPGYLPGFMAERHTVVADEVDQRVNRRVANSACSAAMETLDPIYDTRYPDYDRYHATVARTRTEQALLPVWIIVVAYKGEKFTVGINGQTGKVAVNLPIDAGKQRVAATCEALKDGAGVLAIEFGFLLLIFVVGVQTVGLDEMLSRVGNMLSGSVWAHASATDVIALVFFVAMALFFLVGPVVQAFLRGRRKVLDSMHNVRRAYEADEFDVGGLNVTLSEVGEGPL